MPVGGTTLALIEAKAAATGHPRMGEPLQRLAAGIRRFDVQSFVVHGPTRNAAATSALRPGVAALKVADLPKVLAGRCRSAAARDR